MAKNDNLTDFLTDVADAIRAKKGTTELINPQNFSTEIASIETGGGVAISANDVNFRDYDGTILHSYSKDEFLALSELPELPTQQGLICQGWNYTLEDAQSYVADYGKIEVGATHITDDGKTRLYITVPKYRQDVPLYFSQTVANGVTIDWGDGSVTETLSGTGNVNTAHSYASEGNYVISLEVAEGCKLEFGSYSSQNNIFGSTYADRRVFSIMLTKAELGERVTSINKRAFYLCASLSSITIPQGVTSIEERAFSSCYNLGAIVLPQGLKQLGGYTFDGGSALTLVVMPKSVTSIGYYAFQNCASLSLAMIPQGVTNIDGSTFRSCLALSSIIIPQGVTSIGSSAFYGCTTIRFVIIPEGVTSIGSSAFSDSYSFSFVTMPSSLTTINNYAFQNCYGVAIYDFRALTSVPTLSSTNAFSGIKSDCKIVVPDSLFDEWIAATNWSTYASYIIKASEFNG